MRRPLVWLLVAFLVTLGTEALAVPTPTYDREWQVTPDTFIDEILFGIPKGEGRRRRWRGIRDYALQAYAPAGLDVGVVEQRPTERPTMQVQGMTLQQAAGVPSGQIVGTIAHPGTQSYFDVNDHGAPTAGLLGLTQQFIKGFGSKSWQKYGARRRQLRAGLAHELGHILGLDHGTDPSSVTTPYSFQVAPTPDDLQALIGPEVGLPDPGNPGYRAPSGQALRHRRRGH